MTYSKPDVEVYQQFRMPQADIRPAVLQSCVVGPLYQIFTDEIVGTYDNFEHLYYFPSDLKAGAVLDNSTLKVRVIQYGEEFVVAESNLTTLGLEGNVLVGFEDQFVDYTKDFLAMSIVLHTDENSNDGDYLRIPAGANAGYHKILEIIDSHTLRLAAPLAVAESENYEIRSVGYIVEEEITGFSLRLTPNMGFSGNVAISFKALRTDRVKPFEWSKDDLTNEVGADQITPDNPLAYGASLTLSVLGQNSFVAAMPILSDDLNGYLAAFEELQSTDVYAITCLTHNVQVAQALMAHVKAMSDPTEKRERIGIHNSGFMDKIIKVGYIDVSDGVTSFNGINSTETVLMEPVSFDCDGAIHDYAFTGHAPTRVTFHFDRVEETIAAGALVSYTLTSDPATWQVATADTTDHHVVITAPAGDSIAQIRYKSAANIAGIVNAFGLNTQNEAEYTEYDRMLVEGQITNIEPVTELISINATHITEKRVLLADKPINPAVVKASIPSIQNFVQGSDFIIITDGGFWYLSWADRNMEDIIAQGHTLKISYVKGDAITRVSAPTPGHKALKIRAYDVTPSTYAEKPEEWMFPDGMMLHVVTESDVISITYPGTYVFDRDILALYKTNSIIGAVDTQAVDTLIDIMMLVEAGTYSRNKFVDANAEFITTSKVNAGDKLVIKSGSNAGEYEIQAVLSDSELIVDHQFVPFEFNLNYEIQQGDVSKNDLANWIAQISSSFAERRITNIYCPFVGVSPDGISVNVLPGYYYNCIIVGLIHAIAPQAGLTNLAIPGFSQVFYVSDYFTDKQLDTIAGGGTFIIMQHNRWTTPYVRHQLTTDMSILEKRELSCVKDLDYISKMGRESMRPYIGRFLVNEVTMTTLYSLANAFLAKCKADGLINSGDLISIYVDPNSRDTVIICIQVELPVPLNKIKLYIYV